MIIRDAFRGLTRFEEFRASLGIARNVLADRLSLLTDEGIFDRVVYSERPERFEYRLTLKGRELNIALTALREWGERHVVDGPPLLLRRRSDGKAVTAALVPKGTKTVGVREVELVPRPRR